MKDAFLPPHGPTPHSSFLSMAVAMGALSMEEAGREAEHYPMERAEPEQMFDRGTSAAQFGRYEEAVSVFDDLLAREPGNGAARYNRALAYLHLNRFDEARVGFEEFLAKQPGDAKALSNLAHLFLATNRIREAQETARLSLKSDPRSCVAAFNLGHSLIYHLRRAEAEEAYRRVLPANPWDSGRAAIITKAKQDAEEYRRAGWPEEKLKQMTSLLRQVELNPSGNKQKLAADGRDGFLGANLPTLRQRNEFFTWFHLGPVGEPKTDASGFITEFKPSGPAFRDHVTLRVRTDLSDTIEELWLDIARDFIDNPKETMFACDLAKSFFRNVAAPEDRPVLHELAAEIETLMRAGGSAIVLGKSEQPAKRPGPLSPACRVLFGRAEKWETWLASRRLRLFQDKAWHWDILHIEITI